MTLAEIEETLEKLKVRHSGLDEALLVTLLKAGGWEEKEIKEAVSLFKGTAGNKTQMIAFPAPQDAVSLPQEIANEHLLISGKEQENSTEEISKGKGEIAEPQSLNPAPSLSKREELPHDLPLRPFETSDHIWPFSRYKDVFYGDIPEETVVVPVAAPTVLVPPTSPTPPAPSLVPPQEEVTPAPIPTSEPKPQAPVFAREGSKVAPKPISSEGKGEDKLVFLACVMLIAVLFVLGYMYSNGRL
jgi:hypothetical protein